MAQKMAFLSPATQVLKCWGYVSTNELGDIPLPVESTFQLEPGKWRWDGLQWVTWTPASPTPSLLAAAIDAAIQAIPAIDPRIKAVLVAWRQQIV